MKNHIVIPTYHSLVRAKSRINTKSIAASQKQMQLAYERGKRAEDLSSWERDYLQKQQKPGCIAVAFNQSCYIFRDESEKDIVCLTIYPLPAWFGKPKSHMYCKKEKVRNPRKFDRANTDFDYVED